jgi:hypothetical protein
MPKPHFIRYLTVGIAMLGLLFSASCAYRFDEYLFGMIFEVKRESDIKIRPDADIDVLDYRLGDYSYLPTRANIDRANTGPERVFPSGNMNIIGPRPKQIYFKWRDNSSGKIYEKTVEIENLLPRNISSHLIFMTIYGNQIYIFDYPSETVINDKGQRIEQRGPFTFPKPGYTYADDPASKRYQIYPPK